MCSLVWHWLNNTYLHGSHTMYPLPGQSSDRIKSHSCGLHTHLIACATLSLPLRLLPAPFDTKIIASWPIKNIYFTFNTKLAHEFSKSVTCILPIFVLFVDFDDDCDVVEVEVALVLDFAFSFLFSLVVFVCWRLQLYCSLYASLLNIWRWIFKQHCLRHGITQPGATAFHRQPHHQHQHQ